MTAKETMFHVEHPPTYYVATQHKGSTWNIPLRQFIHQLNSCIIATLQRGPG